MRHLFRHHHEAYRQDAFFNTSAVHQMLTSAREHVPARMCLQAVRDGWVVDPNEQQEGRSLLVGYLGTFPAPSHKAPEATQTWHDEVHTSYRMATGPALDAHLAYRSSQGGTVPVSDLDDPMGPPVPSVEAEVALRLLAMGANPWTQDPDGRDALDQAFSLNWVPVWQTLLNRPDAPSVNDLALRELAVPFLTQPGSQQQMNLPWLHAATAFGRDWALTDLLAQGFDVNQRDAWGRTPLFYAQLASTVKVLLERGADPMAVDAHGQSVGTAWPSLVQASTQLSAMNPLLNERLKPLFDANPEALRAMHRPALYEMVRNGTKDNVLKFLRSHGLSVNDRQDDGQSLLAHTAWQLIRSHDRSPALMVHLLDRVDDVWYVGPSGIPDVLLAWFGTQHNQTNAGRAARQAVNAQLQTRYQWSTDKGYAAFMKDVDAAALALVAFDPALTGPVGNALAHGLYRSMQGDTTPGSKTAKALTVPFAPAKWAHAQDADGRAIGWRVGFTAATLMLRSTPTSLPMPDILSAALRSLFEHERHGNVPAWDATRPWVPYDDQALHAMLVPMAGFDSRRYQRSRLPGFQRDNVLHQAFQTALAQGLELDPAREGFEQALAGIRKNDATIALAVENAALRKGLEEVLKESPAVAPRARPRM